MPIASKYLFVVSMDVDPDKEALFNEVYDTEHVPNILKVPGVRGASRMAGEAFTQSIGGVETKKQHEGPRYTAIYEIDSPQVLLSPGVGKARAKPAAGRAQVRPFTRNRQHALYKVR